MTVRRYADTLYGLRIAAFSGFVIPAYAGIQEFSADADYGFRYTPE